MQGARQHASVDDVRAYWYRFALEEGFVDANTGLRKPGNVVVDERTVLAYISSSRWVADCPNCNAGMAAWPGAHEHACCLDCGHVFTVETPEDAAEAVAVLTARPEPSTRNWHPQRGETVTDLKVENITRALPLAAR
jgi:hypothetical protein